MIVVAKDDVLRGLKRFKRLAKQDLLASSRTSDPAFWEAQAEARRATYTQLMEWIEEVGVEAACERALKEYAALPPVVSDGKTDPVRSGTRQAFDLFFQLVGLDQKSRLQMQGERRRPDHMEGVAVNASS